MNRDGRRGFTLLEVILSLAILVGSLAIISRIVDIAARNSLYAEYHARAIDLAETKMNEIVAGYIPLTATGIQICDDDPDWQWELQVVDGPLPGLKLVYVRVAPSSSGALADLREPVSYELVRYVLDPEYLASVEEELSAEPEESSGAEETSPGAGDGASR